MKIKVLQVIGQLKIGGAETVAVNICRYIDREKFELHYLVYGKEIGDYEKEVLQLGGRVIHIDCVTKNPFKYRKELSKVIKSYGPYHIIHAHMMFHNGIVLDVARRMGVPIRISHAHSTNDGGIVNGIFQKAIRKLYLKYAKKLIVKNSILYIACGKDTGNYLYGRNLYQTKGVLLRNGINLKNFSYDQNKRNKIRKEYHLEEKRVYACIGHFEPVKNHKFLIQIFSKISTKDNNAVLILLGDGILRKNIEMLCRERELEDKVIFLGNVNNVSEWMQAIDFLMMPSLYEGIPVTLIEAQASGLKCFVSDKVAKEANIINLIQYISLDQEENWVKISEEASNYKRNNMIKELSQKGYDVEDNIKLLERYYCKLLESTK